MAIGVIAALKIKPGQEKIFETIFEEQMANVRAHESGNKLYQLFRSRQTEGRYVVVEIYEDEAAFEAHRNGEHMKLTRPRTAPLLDGKIDVELFDRV